MGSGCDSHHFPADLLPSFLSTFRFPQSWEKRQAILDIIEALNDVGATCLITSEAISVGEEREVQSEEYLAQGVIRLQILKTGERAVRIQKMRGTEVDSVPRPYRITDAGIEVYSLREAV